MEEKLTETKTEKTEQIQKEINHYSIYDYLKEKTAVLLAFISAMVAIISFFAKLIALISARKELAFWEFSSSYASLGGESIMYTIIISILFFCFTTASSMLFSSTYEAYLQHKKIHLLVKYYLKKEKHNLKALEKKSKKGKITKHQISILDKVEQIKTLTKKSKRLAYINLFLNLFFIFIIICCNSILFAIATESNTSSNTFLVALVQLIIHLLYFLILKILIDKTVIKKNELKKICNDSIFILKFSNEQEFKEYPFNNIFINGFRSVLSNRNIILIVATIFLSCFILSCSFAFTEFDPTESSKTLQITTIDNTPYAIVCQDNEKYYLEEIKIESKATKSEESKEYLTVYTNKQRIITSDDITIEVKNFADIKKEHKTETIPKDKNNE